MNIPPKNQPSSADPSKADYQLQSPFSFLSPNFIRPLILASLSIAIPLSTSLALKSPTSEKTPTKTLSTSPEKPQTFTFFSLLSQPNETLNQKSKQPNAPEKLNSNLPPSQPIKAQTIQPQNYQKPVTNPRPKIFNNFPQPKFLPETTIAQTNITDSTNIPEPTKQNPKKITQKKPENPSSTISTPSLPQIQLTLSETIILALQNNRDIKNTYLNRIAEKQDLATEEGKFRPTFIPQIAVILNRNSLGIINNNNNQISLGADISVRMPAGGEFSFGWIGAARNNYTNNLPNDSELASVQQNLQLRFTQPLLRGSGVQLNRASIDIARIREQINIITLKTTLTDTITNIIFAYRRLQQAGERVKIETQFLELAKQRKSEFQTLIEAGREAPVDILPYEKAIADREGSLLSAENDRQKAIADLLQILDIDREINILPSDNPTPELTLPDLQNIQQIALENNPNYLSSILNRDISKLDLLLAEDNQRWNLDFNATYGGLSNSTEDTNQNFSAGITLSREFGDLSLKRDVERSKINLLKAENTLQDSRQNLEIEIQNLIRDINLKLKQVELAKNATQLAERQLNIEQTKLQLGGRTSTLEVVRVQNDLILARNQEISAQIDYLNALTTLQQTLGTTLQTWNITIETP